MRVEPETPDHPKFRRLKRRVGDIAMECLVRLWAHCQNGQRGGTWSRIDPEYVEVVAGWAGKPGELYAALKDIGWVEERGTKLVIHDWDKMNSRAKANWENGKLGGRPRDNPNETQLLLGKPKRNPNPRMVNPNPVSGNPKVCMSVSQSVPSTGEKNKEAGARVAASRTQWAALSARVKELEAQGEADLTDEERTELYQKRAELSALSQKQAAGKF